MTPITHLDQTGQARYQCKDLCENGASAHRHLRSRSFTLRHEQSADITIGIGEVRITTVIHNVGLQWPRMNATMNRTQMAAKRLMEVIQYHTFDPSVWQ